MKNKIILILVCLMLITCLNPIKANEDILSVSLNNPPVANAGGPYEGIEGHPLVLDGSRSEDPDGDVLSYRWDFDADEIWDTDWSTNPITEYSYCDDYDFKVFVEVTDGIDSDYASAPIFIENAPPMVFLDCPDSSVEGAGVNMVLSVEDPGLCDRFVYMLCGKPADRPPNQKPELKVKNFYYDEFLETWQWTVSIGHYMEWYDDLELQIMNYPWQGDQGFSNVMFPVGPGCPEVEYITNTPTHVKVNFTTLVPNVYDFYIMTNVPDPQIRWWTTIGGKVKTTGEIGAPQNEKFSAVEIDYDVEILDDGIHTFELSALDDDGASTSTTSQITVENKAPTITPFGPFSGDPNVPITMSATVTDEGTDDLTFLWEFGDGQTQTTTHYNLGEEPDDQEYSWFGTAPFIVTETLEHTYSEEKRYSVKLTVTDDDGGQSTYQTTASTPRDWSFNNPLIEWIIHRLVMFFQRFNVIFFA
jgi:hypothetical protein